MIATDTILYTTFDSPIGELLAVGDERSLPKLHLQESRRPTPDGADRDRDDERFAALREQLGEYFAGARREFDLELELRGSEFERRVWDALRQIPYGETRAYGEIAIAIGAPGQARAVGAANGRNPIAVVVPCHRVIGADGSLTGYAGGLERKRLHLDLEAPHAQLDLSSTSTRGCAPPPPTG